MPMHTGQPPEEGAGQVHFRKSSCSRLFLASCATGRIRPLSEAGCVRIEIGWAQLLINESASTVEQAGSRTFMFMHIVQFQKSCVE